jgi:hypothetical protein
MNNQNHIRGGCLKKDEAKPDRRGMARSRDQVEQKLEQNTKLVGVKFPSNAQLQSALARDAILFFFSFSYAATVFARTPLGRATGQTAPLAFGYFFFFLRACRRACASEQKRWQQAAKINSPSGVTLVSSRIARNVGGGVVD